MFAKRTPGKQRLKYCIQNEPDFYYHPPAYPGFRTIANAVHKGWISVGKPLTCTVLGVIISAAPDKSVDQWVAEHVMEKQSLRNAIQLMSRGVDASGKALAAGVPPKVKGIFDVATGLLFQSWPTNLKPAWGEYPFDSLFGGLGHTKDSAGAFTDIANLQVLDWDINSLKSHVADFEDAFSGIYQTYARKQQLNYLADFIDVFSYMRQPQVISSYNAAYHANLDTWAQFAKVPGAGTFDYVGAYKQIVPSDIDVQVSTALGFFKSATQAALTYWQSAAAASKFSAADVATNVKLLQDDFINNAATYIQLDKAAMTK
ncbi:hypothetical protein LEL_10713 [Akanthomyces lecanii RCEF 1005]|uniref:Uncharacterized protein n=1 Tax=Akanthomyces lecanii RCEF 1005 TaxID=1081108 RepID=A0A167V9M6_CORDF|nr:hypothetical protein LEL_10713 [Akanthomyces lecanii RCEF 1005]